MQTETVASPIEEAISNATAALSGLSACAGIVLVPRQEPAIRQLAFAPDEEPGVHRELPRRARRVPPGARAHADRRSNEIFNLGLERGRVLGILNELEEERRNES